MNRLENKVAIITGGNSGIGEACALLFAKEGAKVVITARREAQLEEVAAKVREAGGDVLAVRTDISNSEDVKKMIDKTIEAYGKLDIIINNAGVLEEGLLPIDRVKNEDMDYLMDINTKGTMNCMREASRLMLEQGSGSIVNVASVAGVAGNGGAAYVASKAAVVGVTRHTAMRCASKNVRCNVICPGNVITPMTMNLNPAALDPDMMGVMASHGDMRLPSCQAEDVANIALFLASDESRAVTGQTIVSDFGCTL